MFPPKVALKSGLVLMGHAGFSYFEGLTPISTARFPAMGNKEFCFVHQVSHMQEFEMRSGDRCLKPRLGRDDILEPGHVQSAGYSDSCLGG